MKSSIKKSASPRLTMPGEALTAEKFKKEVKKAEKGPFYTISESKKLIDEWRRQKHSR
ncbi:MAG: hypothetical protein K2U26_08040 [Cyclobacteriaceae bacterium]|nr:hypothetical protein [Cyclobacteriaceae bacterium]